MRLSDEQLPTVSIDEAERKLDFVVNWLNKATCQTDQQ